MVFEQFYNNMLEASKKMSGQQNMTIDNREELQCLELYDEGWRHDGFDYVSNSYDIIIFWKKDGENKEVRLTLAQQRRLVRRLELKDNENKNDKNNNRRSNDVR